MTTADLTRFPTASAPTRLRLTVRGRRVLAVLASLPAVAALAIAIVSGGAAIAESDTHTVSDVAFETVTVLPGDTLWSIAGSVAPDADPRDVVGEIMRLNAMSGAGLDVGQQIAIPSIYSSGD